MESLALLMLKKTYQGVLIFLATSETCLVIMLTWFIRLLDRGKKTPSDAGKQNSAYERNDEDDVDLDNNAVLQELELTEAARVDDADDAPADVTGHYSMYYDYARVGVIPLTDNVINRSFYSSIWTCWFFSFLCWGRFCKTQVWTVVVVRNWSFQVFPTCEE